ncbi:MAG TPA: cytochrome c3 family protein [Polyangiaceae bacterium]
MTKKVLLSWVCLLVLAGLTAFGCGRQRSARPKPKSLASTQIPLPRPHEDDPKQILATITSSAHAKLDCGDCHAPPPAGSGKDLGEARCDSCHEEQVKAYAMTIHATARSKGKKGAANCQDCHGTHDVQPSANPASHTYPRRLPWTCGKCHANPEVAVKLEIREPLAVRQYIDSVHGRSLLASGLLVAPACNDCHGRAHQLYEAKDARSTVHPKNIANTCGGCHSEARDEYLKSKHAKVLASAQPKLNPSIEKPGAKHQPPTCQTCHTAHSIVESGRGLRLESDRICGKCHENRLERYLETYHGRAHALGDRDVAACHDCHGKHDIRPVAEPASMLSDQNRLSTCQQCHTNAPPNFADYRAHADHTDRKNYPGLYWSFIGMTGLLVGTFGFFGVHSLLWLGRGLIERQRDPQGFRERKRRARDEKGQRLYTRFRPVDRFCHFLVIISFLLLVITGMPLKFHEQPWAKAFFDAIGGPVVAGSMHRFGAMLTGSYFLIHMLSWIGPMRRNRAQFSGEQGGFSAKRFLRSYVFGPDSPFPRLQDGKDLWGHFKWFLGRGKKPKFDKFTYWEKFDYIAVFWGVTVIGLSGLVLWFPTTFTRVLPGWAINIAHVIHSDEALLAAGFIFTFHFFNSHFRPEKWPLDSVMFSGRLTEAEMVHEHPAQYERLAKEGRLDDIEARDEWQDWKWVFNPFGAVAILLGLVLVVAILWALIGSLT